MAKKITRRPAKKPVAKRVTTKKPNTNNKSVTNKKPNVSNNKRVTTKRPNVSNNKTVQGAAKKVSRFGLPGKAIALGTLLTTGAMSMMKKKDPTFWEAFRKARKEKGPNSTFNYKGKKYSTVTKDQIKKAGHSTLRSYLNAGGKKKTATKPKPKRRKIGPRNRR